MLSDTDPDISSSLQSMQAFASVAERNQWRKCGCRMTEGVWMSCDGKPCLPRHFFPHYAKSMHGKDHASKGGMVIQMKELWFTKGFTIFAENFCKRCVICNTHNVAKGIKMSQVSQPALTGPFEYFCKWISSSCPHVKERNIVWCWWTCGPNGSRYSQHQNRMQQQ